MLTINKHKNIKTDCFVEHPSIILVRKFSENSLEQFTKDFISAESSEQEIIPIQIDSYGGDIGSLFGMIELIERSKKIICTFCNTKAYSCGSVLLASGTRGYRFASKNSSILVHEMSAGTFGKQNEMNNEICFLDELNLRFLNILDSYCDQEKGFFKKKLIENGNADLYYSPTKAKKEGIIDYVKSPTFEVEIIQKFKLS